MGNSCKKKRNLNSSTHKSVIELESRKSEQNCKHEVKHIDLAPKTSQNSELKTAKIEIKKISTECKNSRNLKIKRTSTESKDSRNLKIKKTNTESKDSRNLKNCVNSRKDLKDYSKSTKDIKDKAKPEKDKDHVIVEKIIKDIAKSDEDIKDIKSQKDVKDKSKSEKCQISNKNIKGNTKLELNAKVHNRSEVDIKNYTKSENVQSKKDPILLNRNTSIPVQSVMPNIKQSINTDKITVDKQSLNTDKRTVEKQSINTDKITVDKQSINTDKITVEKQSINTDKITVDKITEEICVRRGFPPSECFPIGKVDRMMLRMCPKYIGMRGCHANYCYRFHVCSYWIRGTCKRKNCPHDHHFQSTHNQEMFQLVQSESYGEAELRNQLKINFYKGKNLSEDLSPAICMNYILRQCKEENCDDIHINYSSSWEIYLNDEWSKFSKAINEVIESRFYNPFISEFLLETSSHLGQARDSLHQDIFLGKPIQINFNNMSLKTSDNVSCDIRRLTTFSDCSCFKSVATRWVWYWIDSNSKWNMYSFAFIKKYLIIAFSDYIETQYLKRVRKEFFFKFHPNGPCFKINLENMNQIDLSTSESFSIRRRPVPIQQLKK